MPRICQSKRYVRVSYGENVGTMGKRNTLELTHFIGLLRGYPAERSRIPRVGGIIKPEETPTCIKSLKRA